MTYREAMTVIKRIQTGVDKRKRIMEAVREVAWLDYISGITKADLQEIVRYLLENEEKTELLRGTVTGQGQVWCCYGCKKSWVSPRRTPPDWKCCPECGRRFGMVDGKKVSE